MINKIIRNIKELFEINKRFFVNKLKKDKKKIIKDYKNIKQRIQDSYSPVFILSTGRCGTKLINNYLNKSEEISSYHSPVPEFIYYSKVAYENNILNRENKLLEMVFDSGRFELIFQSYKNNKIYVETNNRITFFSPQIAKLYPKAKFVHLIRNPADFIRSGIRRKWYTYTNLHDIGRIKPVKNKNEFDSQWSDIEKIGWLWNETNLFIEKFKKNTSNNRIITIKFEELIENPEVFKKLQRFIGIKPWSQKKILNAIETKVNKQKTGKFPEYKDWTEKQKKLLKQLLNDTLTQGYNYKL